MRPPPTAFTKARGPPPPGREARRGACGPPPLSKKGVGDPIPGPITLKYMPPKGEESRVALFPWPHCGPVDPIPLGPSSVPGCPRPGQCSMLPDVHVIYLVAPNYNKEM